MGHAVGFDIGGTKILAGVVDERGEILTSVKESVELHSGPQGLIQQIVRLGNGLMEQHPKPKGIGIASAGPLSPKDGTLLDPTNLLTNGKGWGIVSLVPELKKHWGHLDIRLENDAAAAAQAVRWSDEGNNVDNFMVVTLGTGIGVGIFVNGELLRSGRHLHTEASHMSLNFEDKTAPCGCGKFGCIEAYLSGPNFARWWCTQNKIPVITAEELTQKAKAGDVQSLSAFETYAKYFAAAIDAWVCTFSPEKIILTGSFSDAAPLFLDKAYKHLEKSLARRRVGYDLMPKIMASRHKRETGLLGSVREFFA